MRKGIWKKGMVAVMTAALLVGNVGNYGVNIRSIVKAADIEYVPLNQEFESRSEAYFQLTESGIVSIDERVDIYRVADNGNETSIFWGYYYEGEKIQLRLPKGVYRVNNERGSISKICFQAESNSTVEQEWNDTFDTANVIQPNIAYVGNLNLCGWDSSDYYQTKDVDYYKFELEQNGVVQLQYYLEDLTYEDSSDEWNYNKITLYSEDEDFNIKEKRVSK